PPAWPRRGAPSSPPPARWDPTGFRPPRAATGLPVAPAMGSGRVPGLCLLVLLVHARAA
ncbi:hypothetical protein P7K49_007830, partial [Saguinus oedipus]